MRRSGDVPGLQCCACTRATSCGRLPAACLQLAVNLEALAAQPRAHLAADADGDVVKQRLGQLLLDGRHVLLWCAGREGGGAGARVHVDEGSKQLKTAKLLPALRWLAQRVTLLAVPLDLVSQPHL